MVSKIYSAAVLDIVAFLVEVEANLESQLPAFATVGLPDSAVKESREHVTVAIKNTEFRLPKKQLLLIWQLLTLKKRAQLLICGVTRFILTQPCFRVVSIYTS